MSKEEKASYDKAYNLKHKERNAKRKRQYYLDNKEERLAYAKRYREENREKANASVRNHYENNSVFYKAKNAKRRAAKIQRTPCWADELVIKMIYQDAPDGMQVDHIIPLQGKNVSGLHVAHNLQYLTPEENMRKGNKHVET